MNKSLHKFSERGKKKKKLYQRRRERDTEREEGEGRGERCMDTQRPTQEETPLPSSSFYKLACGPATLFTKKKFICKKRTRTKSDLDFPLREASCQKASEGYTLRILKLDYSTRERNVPAF